MSAGGRSDRGRSHAPPKPGATPGPATTFESRLPAVYIEKFLTRNGLTAEQIERGLPCWRTSDGLIPITIEDIERMISAQDPVAWAWLNLAERDSVRAEDGSVLIHAGAPWSLFPIQAEMARIKGNLVVECGAEVGKTRDIVLGTLWEVDTWLGGASDLIAADSDITIEEIWSEIEYQLEQNQRIGGGVIDSSMKPFREKVFANGSRFQMRLCGHDGKQFRGGHFSPGLRADECAKWKNAPQFNELWRAGRPGSRFRIYSTPDGDYSSPFYSLCERAVPITAKLAKEERERGDAEEPQFRKFNITKMQLPPPFWTEARADKYRQMYGGENSVGWQTNVLGKWGSPSYSIFPMPSLKPCLKYLPHYRIVVALIDREAGRVILRAARLSPELERVDGSVREELLLREDRPMLSGRDLGVEIARFFPDLTDWVDPVLFCGADLGSASDPSEFLFVRKIGDLWQDVFRLHLENADWPAQAEVVAALDHASGHRVKYGFDSGSAGSALVQVLTQMEQFSTCPICHANVYFAERLQAFGFGDKCDEIDMETGQTIPNPDSLDPDGRPKPFRISNKEFSTRALERKMQNMNLAIAHDGGAEDQMLAAAQLLVNHTSIGVTSKGERRFKATDDHAVDARRQVALVIANAFRGEPWLPADPGLLVRRTPGEPGGVPSAASAAELPRGRVSREFSDTLGSGVGRIFGGGGVGSDW